MPRSSRSSARPSPSSRMPSGSRSASTQAYHPPPQQHAPPPAPHQAAPPMAQPAMGGGGGGLFANMASTAAGVAVGSTVGHGISNMLFGGSGSSEPAPQPQQQQQQPQPWAQDYNAQNAAKGAACEAQSKDLLRCFEATNNDTTACSYYLEQLKACSAAAQSFA